MSKEDVEAFKAGYKYGKTFALASIPFVIVVFLYLAYQVS